MTDALILLLKEFVDAYKRSYLLPEKDLRDEHSKEYRMLMGNSSTALHNNLLGSFWKLDQNKKVNDLLNKATNLVNTIYVRGFVRSGERPGEKWIDELIDTCELLCKIKNSSKIEGEEVVVGFDEEVVTLLDQVTATCIKRLQVISIAGMAGLGKTTLARKLFNDPLVEYSFDIRAWTCVSQDYLIKNLLVSILSSFVHELTDEIYKMSETQLGEKLYRLLKGRKYLVVLDDIWDSKAWNDLKIYFPDDKTGSRVMFTVGPL